jgi:hypothetical protein
MLLFTEIGLDRHWVEQISIGTTIGRKEIILSMNRLELV